jgi:polysaccharide export outer membrane protein
MIKKRFLQFLTFCLAIHILTGCVSHKEIEYLQLKSRAPKSFSEAEVLDYRLKPNDQLLIQINSLDDPSTNVFPVLNSQGGGGTAMDPFGAALASHEISKTGYLEMPVLGNIYVQDKSLYEVDSILTEAFSHMLSQPYISVKLINRYFTVIGEVKSPGRFAYPQNKLSVFDAIAIAGDMVNISNRKEVTLTRNENGKNNIVNIDMTNPEILSSEYYWIKPNDILYVKPMKKRIWTTNGEFPISLLFGIISTTLLIYTVIKP